MHIYICL